MHEPLFLLVLMAMTALGVRVFLGQLHGTPLRLPSLRVRLPRLSLPSLPRLRRPRPGRRRARSEEYLPRGGYADASYVQPGARFVPPLPNTSPSGYSSLEEPEGYDEEDDYDADAYLPVNQVDFFAAEDEASKARLASPSNASRPSSSYAGPADEAPVDDSGLPLPEASPIQEVAAEPELDPNDIMSFFERPAAVTELPATLREDIAPVSAAQLLAEAREVRALLRGDRV